MVNDFFFLHIKKCGGTSLRSSIKNYHQIKRSDTHGQFILYNKMEYNDAINNYRIKLGPYDNKRMLFCKKYLYTEEEFNSMYKFTIVRNPLDRIISAYNYLFTNKQIYLKNVRLLKMKFNFDFFINSLDYILEEKPDRHLYTHIAPFFNDITDESGNILVDNVLKIENIDSDFKIIINKLGLKSDLVFAHKNKTSKNKTLLKKRILKNQNLSSIFLKHYEDDFNYFNYKFQ